LGDSLLSGSSRGSNERLSRESLDFDQRALGIQRHF
jgi:hypothetical protein